jgi:hypothetical protein
MIWAKAILLEGVLNVKQLLDAPATKKTNSAKKHWMRQAQDGQEQACNQLPQTGSDGLIG